MLARRPFETDDEFRKRYLVEMYKMSVRELLWKLGVRSAMPCSLTAYDWVADAEI